jgi:hypothetical protein
MLHFPVATEVVSGGAAVRTVGLRYSAYGLFGAMQTFCNPFIAVAGQTAQWPRLCFVDGQVKAADLGNGTAKGSVTTGTPQPCCARGATTAGRSPRIARIDKQTCLPSWVETT